MRNPARLSMEAGRGSQMGPFWATFGSQAEPQ
jgi:hypothetical protein